MKKIILVTGSLLAALPVTCLANTATAKTPTSVETWISFLPVIFFGILITSFFFKMKKSAVSLSDILAEKDPDAGALPQANQQPLPASTSRVIAFLTGVTALIMGVCICTFYMYQFFSDPATTINISNLTNVIWGLGIGVVPYGFNKVSAAVK